MRWVPLAAVASLPGLIPQLQGLAQAGLSDGAAEFVVLNRIPHHVDPFSFGERGPLTLSLMVVFNLSWAWRRRGDYVSRLVGVYQVALTVTTVTFVAARAAGGFELLLLTPFRVFPVFTALLFFYVVADHLISSRSATDFASGRMRGTSRRVQLVSGALATVATLVLWNPVPRWVNAVDATVEGWRDSTTDLEKALLWFPDNTPLDARVASPPWVEEIFYLSERAQFVSWEAIPYDRISEWIDRLELSVSDPAVWERGATNEERLESFSSLPLGHWVSLSEEYGLSYVVTTARYVREPSFEAGQWKVYELG